MSIQVPDLHISSITKARGKATVKIASRSDASHAGQFSIELDVKFDPVADLYPIGTVKMSIALTDSSVASATATSVDQLASMGKHTPTLLITGKCDVASGQETVGPTGCRYWLLIANNKRPLTIAGTPDIISFLIFDRNGVRASYGTGPVVSGDIDVAPTSN